MPNTKIRSRDVDRDKRDPPPKEKPEILGDLLTIAIITIIILGIVLILRGDTIDLYTLGAFFATMITALGLRDLLKLYVTRHEGCGKANCQKTLSNYLVIKK